MTETIVNIKLFTCILLTILAFEEGVVSIALKSAAALYNNNQQ